MASDAALWRDLLQYKNYKTSKSVVMAARALLNLVRDVCPGLLRRRDRGRKAGEVMVRARREAGGKDGEGEDEEGKYWRKFRPAPYGTILVSEGVDGAELLKESGNASDEEEEEEEEEGDDGDKEEEEETKEGSEAPSLIPLDDVEPEEEEQAKLRRGEKKSTAVDSASDPPSLSSGKSSLRQLRNALKASKKNKKGKKRKLEATRLLTDEDFQRIRDIKRRREEEEEEEEEEEGEDGGGGGEEEQSGKAQMVTSLTDSSLPVDADDLAGVHERRRRNLEERVAAAKEGTLGFSRGMSLGKERTGGKNNRQQKRNKNFLMMTKKRGILDKQKNSLQRQRNELKRHIKNVQRNGKTLSRIRRKRRSRT